MAQRKPFIVRVEPGGGEVTVEDVRGARVARLASLDDVGAQIAAWLGAAPAPMPATADGQPVGGTDGQGLGAEAGAPAPDRPPL